MSCLIVLDLALQSKLSTFVIFPSILTLTFLIFLYGIV